MIFCPNISKAQRDADILARAMLLRDGLSSDGSPLTTRDGKVLRYRSVTVIPDARVRRTKFATLLRTVLLRPK